MKESVAGGAIQTYNGKATLADGIAVKTPGKLTFDICSRYVDDIVTVDEGEIAEAILWLIERVKTVAEGAGAVSVAALMSEKVSGVHNKKVVSLVSGGNIDVNNMTRIINRGLTKSWRKVYLSTVLPDQPGELVKFLSIIADSGANVLSVTHERSQHSVGIGHTAVSLELETANEKHVEQLTETLKERQYHVLVK